jgi:nitric oxide reductase NorQ protein
VLLTGPTGCGKTRFVEAMAWRLGRPLVTVACHEDLTAGDLTGRWLLDAEGTRWQDGPLALAARFGAICYLDELAEARSDALVVVHPLADSRRALPLERRGELLQAHPDFLLVASCNPPEAGLQRSLKAATRQRFCALAFGYPDPTVETEIVAREAGIEPTLAARLVALAVRTRRLQDEGLDDGASTRLLVHAARLIAAGLAPRAACRHAIAAPLANDAVLAGVLADLVDASFE